MILIIINQNKKTIDGDNKLTGDTGKVGTQTHCNEERRRGNTAQLMVKTVSRCKVKNDGVNGVTE